jgi:hypothetical protein
MSIYLSVIPEMKKMDITAPYFTVIFGWRGPKSEPNQGHIFANTMLSAVPIKNQCFQTALINDNGALSVASRDCFMVAVEPAKNINKPNNISIYVNIDLYRFLCW